MQSGCRPRSPAEVSAVRDNPAERPERGRIWLAVDGEVRQDGDIAQQIWGVPEALSHLSALYELCPGDLMFTGTPAGVGPVEAGNHLTGGIDGIAEIEISVV